MAKKFNYINVMQQKGVAGFTSNAGAIANKYQNVADHLGKKIAGLLHKKGEQVLAKVRQYSSIQHVSLDNLHRMGHPYAKRHYPGGKHKFAKAKVLNGFSVSIPASYYINRQSGGLFEGWRISKQGWINTRHDAAEVRIFNIRKGGSAFIKGTPKMIKRPIVEHAITMVEKTTVPLSKQISDYIKYLNTP